MTRIHAPPWIVRAAPITDESQPGNDGSKSPLFDAAVGGERNANGSRDDTRDEVGMTRWTRWFVVPLATIGLAVLLSACGSGDENGGDDVTPGGGQAAVGMAAPAFDLPTADGGSLALPADEGGNPALLYFSMGPG